MSVGMYSLREASIQLIDQFIRYRDSSIHHGDKNWVGRHALANTDPAAWIAALGRRARGEEIPEEWTPWVPEAQFWIVKDDMEIVGDVELRHPLTAVLRQLGGNIGYFTHREHRRRGVATFALRSGLIILRRWRLNEALLTCRDDNIASIKTIESAGGVRQSDSEITGPRRRRYLIDLGSLSTSGDERSLLP